jgi:probable DNA metabolism protein
VFLGYAMTEYTYDGSLEGLFAILDRICRSPNPDAVLPGHVRRPPRQSWQTRPLETARPDDVAPSQPDLFGDCPEAAPSRAPSGSTNSNAAFLAAASTAVLCGTAPDSPAAQQLRELSANAYGHFVQGWMSELPIEAALIRFAWKVLAAGLNAPGGLGSAEARERAETAAADRGDPDTQTALAAAYKVWKETDRLRGLLRFSPDRSGTHIARCAPDHFVLPALADHFTLRFGEAPWAIIDERRGLALARKPGEEARLVSLEELHLGIGVAGNGPHGNDDPWEDLWRGYHRAVTIENRINPQLQKQFMPQRYWKYLPEIEIREEF